MPTEVATRVASHVNARADAAPSRAGLPTRPLEATGMATAVARLALPITKRGRGDAPPKRPRLSPLLGVDGPHTLPSDTAVIDHVHPIGVSAVLLGRGAGRLAPVMADVGLAKTRVGAFAAVHAVMATSNAASLSMTPHDRRATKGRRPIRAVVMTGRLPPLRLAAKREAEAVATTRKGVVAPRQAASLGRIAVADGPLETRTRAPGAGTGRPYVLPNGVPLLHA